MKHLLAFILLLTGGALSAFGQPAITGFTLVDALNDRDVGSLADGATVDASPSANLSVRANVTGSSTHVDFSVTGAVEYGNMDFTQPYALCNDRRLIDSSDYYLCPLFRTDGTYTLSATAYDGAVASAPASINFTVTGNNSVTPAPATAVRVGQDHDGYVCGTHKGLHSSCADPLNVLTAETAAGTLEGEGETILHRDEGNITSVDGQGAVTTRLQDGRVFVYDTPSATDPDMLCTAPKVTAESHYCVRSGSIAFTGQTDPEQDPDGTCPDGQEVYTLALVSQQCVSKP